MEAKIRYSADDISISPITEGDIKSLSALSCGVEPIDSFFHNEVVLCAKYRYLSPYKCTLNATGEIVGAFTLANDILRLEYEDIVDFPNVAREYDAIFQQQSSYPAVNIGHLSVRSDLQSSGIGRMIVEFVIATFSRYSATGCQFITVDALNNPRALSFYQDKIGFEFQTVTDIGKPTRRMYYDIFTAPEVGREE